ncbi:MAG TPA: class I SAM-dependent methyltransferase [Casimicrobiaceae bacterium]
MTTETYDRIARFYDADMARNMPFDDIGFYVRLGTHAAGPVLELGCGNGRILFALLRTGCDVTGIDSSAAMLQELRSKATAGGIAAPVALMDIRDLALPQRFALILCPYSLVTYVTTDRDLARLLHNVREHLQPGGRFVVDAFVPRPVATHAEFQLDYRRPLGNGKLARWKRIRVIDNELNLIERRYQVVDGEGNVLEEIDVAETIRPCTSALLRDAVRAAGLVPEREWWDYGTQARAEDARFYTLSARRPAS